MKVMACWPRPRRRNHLLQAVIHGLQRWILCGFRRHPRLLSHPGSLRYRYLLLFFPHRLQPSGVVDPPRARAQIPVCLGCRAPFAQKGMRTLPRMPYMYARGRSTKMTVRLLRLCVYVQTPHYRIALLIERRCLSRD